MSTSPYAPLHVVGLGPGDGSLLTPEAARCLEQSAVIAGYSGYIALLPEALLRGKRVISAGMRQEVARVREALAAAKGGETTSLVCSGDPGIYAMAGLALELLEHEGPAADELPLHVVPGVPAVCAAAALLGAPLMHDFACISLSDLLTPRKIIEHRLECAFAGDFVVALYNPCSKRRPDPLAAAYAAASRHRDASTPVGIVRKAFRPGQDARLTTLERAKSIPVDMFSLIIVGNSASRIVPGSNAASPAWEHGARMLTPRGYAKKYDLTKKTVTI